MEEKIKDIRDTEDVEIDLLELAGVLWRKVWAIVMCLVIGAVIAGGYTKLMITPQYTATSMIYILGQTTSITSVTDLQIRSELTADFTIMAKSRPVIEGVIDDLNLDMTYEQLESEISLENPTDSHILKIHVTDADPEFAKKISNAMADSVADNISSIMATDKPSIAEKAVTPKAPSSPNLLKNTAMGGLIGAVLAIAVIVVMYLMDDTIKTEEDVRKYLQLNTLAEIPMEKKNRKKTV